MTAFDVYGAMGRVDRVDAEDYTDAVVAALDGPVIVPDDERVFRVVEAGEAPYFAATVRCDRDGHGHAIRPRITQLPRDVAQQAATDGGPNR